MPTGVADRVIERVPIDPPGVSSSAPPSISATATSTSSLLAAQCSGVSATAASVVVGVSAGLKQQGDGGGCGGEVPRPVGGGMQRGAPATLEAFAADHVSRRELRSLTEEMTQRVQVATMRGRDQPHGDRVAVRQGQLGR
jgi:hypothetical protein